MGVGGRLGIVVMVRIKINVLHGGFVIVSSSYDL